MIPNYQQPQYQNPYLTRPTNGYGNYPTDTGINWVQGIEGAKAYQMGPNHITQLMDSENDGIFYIKVTDNIGMANLRVFRYTEVTTTDVSSQKQDIDLSQYVRRDEVSEMIKVALSEVKNEPTVQPAKSTGKSRGLITD